VGAEKIVCGAWNDEPLSPDRLRTIESAGPFPLGLQARYTLWPAAARPIRPSVKAGLSGKNV